MKKLLVVLLSLGLIVAFSMPAAAVDVKFSGEYYVVGIYDNNPNLTDPGYSQAYFAQRLRIKPVFEIAPGLKLTTQFDALEKAWGDNEWRRGAGSFSSDGTSSRSSLGVATRLTQENIEFEQSYVTFDTAVGQVQIGYQTGNVWGSDFGNTPTTMPRAQIMTKVGDFTMGFIYEKYYETLVANRGIVDGDSDSYALAGIYKTKGIEAGMLFKYYVDKTRRPASNYSGKYFLLSPYAKLAFGPVYIETEVNYLTGKAREYETAATDIDMASWSAIIDGSVKFGPAKVGAMFAYVKGNDFSTDKSTGSLMGGYGWNPALMLMNGDMKNWAGNYDMRNNPQGYIYGPAGCNGLSDMKFNTIWYQLYAEYKMSPKLGFTTALTYATVETKKLSATTEALSDKLGTEFDVTADYKIFDNLSYMVGAGYLWTGDYMKLANAAAKIDNNYILTNKLTLKF